MKLPSPIPMDLAEMIAARLRVIGDPNRIRILDQLRDGELSVAQITERLGTSQQNASKHLGVLLQAGIVARRKEGTSSYYSVADQSVYELCEQVCGGLQTQLCRTDRDARGRAMRTAAPRKSCPTDLVARCSGWPLERVLFAMAGTMTNRRRAARRARQPVVPAARRVRRPQPVAVRCLR